MPLTAQYKTMGGRTAIDDILDLDDSADQQRQVYGKYIRNHKASPEGLYAPGMQQGGPPNMPQQMMAQEMISTIHPADPRYASHQNSMGMQQGMQQGKQQGMQQGMRMQQPVVEDYKEISIRDVASRIFDSVPSFIDALDDSENPLHKVATSFLENGTPGSGDKIIYIIIIVILSIAIACLLYKFNQKS